MPFAAAPCQVDDAGKQLIRVTHDALMKAVEVCKPGVRYRDLGETISKHVQQAG
jgi:methionyl aminopeptidase